RRKFLAVGAVRLKQQPMASLFSPSVIHGNDFDAVHILQLTQFSVTTYVIKPTYQRRSTIRGALNLDSKSLASVPSSKGTISAETSKVLLIVLRSRSTIPDGSRPRLSSTETRSTSWSACVSASHLKSFTAGSRKMRSSSSL